LFAPRIDLFDCCLGQLLGYPKYDNNAHKIIVYVVVVVIK